MIASIDILPARRLFISLQHRRRVCHSVASHSRARARERRLREVVGADLRPIGSPTREPARTEIVATKISKCGGIDKPPPSPCAGPPRRQSSRLRGTIVARRRAGWRDENATWRYLWKLPTHDVHLATTSATSPHWPSPPLTHARVAACYSSGVLLIPRGDMRRSPIPPRHVSCAEGLTSMNARCRCARPSAPLRPLRDFGSRLSKNCRARLPRRFLSHGSRGCNRDRAHRVDDRVVAFRSRQINGPQSRTVLPSADLVQCPGAWINPRLLTTARTWF